MTIRDYKNQYVQIFIRTHQASSTCYTGKVKDQSLDTIVLEPFTNDDSWVDWDKLSPDAKIAIQMYRVQFEVEVPLANLISISLLPKSGGYL